VWLRLGNVTTVDIATAILDHNETIEQSATDAHEARHRGAHDGRRPGRGVRRAWATGRVRPGISRATGDSRLLALGSSRRTVGSRRREAIMRRWICFAAALLLGVTVVACGDDEETSETTATTPTTALTTTTPTTVVPATIPTAAELEAMLLTADDTEGWQAGEPINEMDLAASAEVPCEAFDPADPTVPQPVGMNPTIAERLTADAGVQFDATDDQYTHLIELLITGDAEQLDTDLGHFLGAMQDCAATWSTVPSTLSASEEAMLPEFEQLTLPDLSDQQWAYRITSPADGVRGYSGYVRVGTVAVNLGVMEARTDAEPQITDEQFVQLLEIAVVKVTS
jgi:hypothetical protein